MNRRRLARWGIRHEKKKQKTFICVLLDRVAYVAGETAYR
jgi:hypothetical protein